MIETDHIRKGHIILHDRGLLHIQIRRHRNLGCRQIFDGGCREQVYFCNACQRAPRPVVRIKEAGSGIILKKIRDPLCGGHFGKMEFLGVRRGGAGVITAGDDKVFIYDLEDIAPAFEL